MIAWHLVGSNEGVMKPEVGEKQVFGWIAAHDVISAGFTSCVARKIQ
jgi:hypothetical protein